MNGPLACLPARFGRWWCWARLGCLSLASDPKGQPGLRLAQRTTLTVSGRSGGNKGGAGSRDFGQVGEACGFSFDWVVWVGGSPRRQQRTQCLGCGRGLHSASGCEGLLVHLGGEEGVQDEHKRLGVGFEVQFLYKSTN